jgi:hypothetical protein
MFNKIILHGFKSTNSSSYYYFSILCCLVNYNERYAMPPAPRRQSKLKLGHGSKLLYAVEENQGQHNIRCAAARGEGWNKTIQSGWPVGKLKAPLPLLPACRYYCPTAPLAGRAINIHFLPLPSRVVSQRSNSRPMRRCPTGRLLLSSASTIVHPWKR